MQKAWKEICCNGFLPTRRWRHTTVAYKDTILLFGGCESATETKSLNDLYQLVNTTWHKLTSDQFTRCSHSAVVYDNHMYVFGGYTQGTTPTDHFRQYNILSGQWSCVITYGNFTPEKRCGHSAVVYDHCMICYGGWTGSVILNEVVVFNFVKKIWKKIDFDGVQPVRRSRHSACVDKDEMYIFGGNNFGVMLQDLWSLNLTTWKWRKIETESPPSTRINHTAIIHDGKMIVFGGSDNFTPTKVFNDLYEFDFSQNRWTLLKLQNSPPEICGHSIAHISEGMAVCCGRGDSQYYNTVFLLKLGMKSFTTKLISVLLKNAFCDVEFL